MCPQGAGSSLPLIFSYFSLSFHSCQLGFHHTLLYECYLITAPKAVRPTDHCLRLPKLWTLLKPSISKNCISRVYVIRMESQQAPGWIDSTMSTTTITTSTHANIAMPHYFSFFLPLPAEDMSFLVVCPSVCVCTLALHTLAPLHVQWCSMLTYSLYSPPASSSAYPCLIHLKTTGLPLTSGGQRETIEQELLILKQSTYQFDLWLHQEFNVLIFRRFFCCCCYHYHYWQIKGNDTSVWPILPIEPYASQSLNCLDCKREAFTYKAEAKEQVPSLPSQG